MADFKSVVDEAIKKNLDGIVGKEIADQVETVVKRMRLERAVMGRDSSGLDDATKISFVKELRNLIRGEKSALLISADDTGGYLVPQEVYAGILRIAETVGLVARDARRFTISSGNSLDVPRYTGSALSGDYIGEDEEASETSIEFGDARLNLATWVLIVRVGNTMIADANVNIADWILSMAAEGLAYRLDKEGFMGGTFVGSPFVGLLQSGEVTTHTLATGSTSFDDFGIVEASDAIGAVKTAALTDAAFYFHRTVWAKLRAKATSGVFEFAQTNMMMNLRRENGIQPVGEILGYPVYTTDILPAYSATAVSTKFGFFGSISQALLVGEKGSMEVAKAESGSVGGKELFKANQVAYRFINRHAIAIGLPTAGVAIKTAAS
ncbi:major_cap_HK97, phage major capsid protein, HK97 family [uncultured Caudovirales phage]|uniref:Major_cap_HK97, phage major capsid protein, HK97 family n=1 Tax=uncultured Caudovirales phage TaxID=2100421 RepID=A0A6J5N2V4_9CAUD|nr:major_cap_HK97, phage major capsid protein, HK97 family [uncultured Caudovirales phage]